MFASRDPFVIPAGETRHERDRHDDDAADQGCTFRLLVATGVAMAGAMGPLVSGAKITIRAGNQLFGPDRGAPITRSVTLNCWGKVSSMLAVA